MWKALSVIGTSGIWCLCQKIFTALVSLIFVLFLSWSLRTLMPILFCPPFPCPRMICGAHWRAKWDSTRLKQWDPSGKVIDEPTPTTFVFGLTFSCINCFRKACLICISERPGAEGRNESIELWNKRRTARQFGISRL